MSTLKNMDHTAYPKGLKKLSDEALRGIIEQCTEVIELQKDFNPNCGYYQDEIHYARMELRIREQAKAAPMPVKCLEYRIEAHNRFEGNTTFVVGVYIDNVWAGEYHGDWSIAEAESAKARLENPALLDMRW